MSNKTIHALVLSVLMIVSMVAFAGVPAPAAADDPAPAHHIDDDVTNNLTNESATDIGTQASDAVFVDDTLEKANGTTEVLIQVERPDLTVDDYEALQSHAEESQEPVIRSLDSFDAVHVENQHWLGNLITASVDFNKVNVESIAGIDGVSAVSENHEVERPEQPDLNDSGELTGVNDTATLEDNEYTYGLEQMDLPGFHDEFDTQGEGTTIAVLDDGLDPEHPDLNVSDGAIFIGGTAFGGVDDLERDSGHGDHVSGTAVGISEPTGDVPRYSVAPGAELLKGDIFFSDADVDNVVGAMEWAIENDADVISGSFGFPPAGEENTWNPNIAAVIDDANAAGVVVSISSGNEGAGDAGGPVTSPATEFESFAVGATDEEGDVAAFSSGALVSERTTEFTPGTPADFPDTYPREYIQPDVSAAGVNVLSSGPLGAPEIDGGLYSYAQGTSMAQPHVAGAAALVQSATAEELDPHLIEAALEETAEKPDDLPPRDIRYGAGIINVTAATAVAEELVTVEGAVTNNQTDQSIVGTTIETDTGQVVASNEAGAYAADVSPNAESVEVTADAFGYESESKVVEISQSNATNSGGSTPEQTTSGTEEAELLLGAGQTADEIQLGDVTESGDVTIADAVAIQRESLGLDPGSDSFNETLADVNRDHEITIEDAVLAQRISLGLADGAHLSVAGSDVVDHPEQVGDPLTVTATIKNTGDLGAIDGVELRVDTDGELEQSTAVAEQSIDIGAESTERAEQSVMFEVDTSSFAPGEYHYGVFTSHENETSSEPLELGEPETVPADEPVDFELEPVGAAELARQAPAFAEAGIAYDVLFESAQYNNVTFTLANASTIDDDQITFHDGSFPFYEPGEKIPIDDGVQEWTANLGSETEAGDVVALELTFEGDGVEPVTLETRETELDDELDPPEFELSDIQPDDVLPIDDEGTIEPSVMVENSGQEPEIVEIDYRIGTGVISPLTSEFLDGQESAEIRETIEGIEELYDVGDTTTHRFDALRPTDLGLPTTDDTIETEVLLVRADTGKYEIESVNTPGSAAPGEQINVSADLFNIGEIDEEQDVHFLFEGDTVATESFATSSGTTDSVDFESVELTDEPGIYTHSVVTEDDEIQAPVTVGTSEITGTVTDESTEDVVQNVEVELEDDSGTTVHRSTDESGDYSFSNLPAGTYTVNVAETPDGYHPEVVLTVEEGETVEQNFTIEPRDPVVAGTVTETIEDSPVANVTVIDGDQSGTDPGSGDFGPFHTNEDGEFAFDAFDEGLERGDTIALRVIGDRFEDSPLEFVDVGPGETEADLEIDPLPSVSFNDQAASSTGTVYADVTTPEASEIEIADAETDIVVGSADVDPKFEDANNSVGVDLDMDLVEFREHNARLIGENDEVLAEDSFELLTPRIEIENLREFDGVGEDETVNVTADMKSNLDILSLVSYDLRVNASGEPLDEASVIDDDSTAVPPGGVAEIGIEVDFDDLDAEPGDTFDYGIFAPPGFDDIRPNATSTLEITEPESNLEISDLEPTEPVVEPAENINVSATVENTGEIDGEKPVEFRLDDEQVSIKENVSLDAGDSTTVTFTDIEAPAEEGEYSHSVWSEDDEEAGRLIVTEDG